MRLKYKDLLDWMNGIDAIFYKQHSGGFNFIRGVRLFLFPPNEFYIRNDYSDLKNEIGFRRMKIFATMSLLLFILILIDLIILSIFALLFKYMP
jgi:hypothetical protein